MSWKIETVFKFCPRCGAGGFALVESAAYRCQDCGFVYHANPAIGVGGFLTDRDGNLLFTRRANDPGKGKLSLPGGFVDFGETAEAALRREIQEEIGLQVDQFQYLASLPNRYPYKDVVYLVLDIFYTCQVESFESARAKTEVQEICLLKPSQVSLDAIAFSSVRQAMQIYRERGKQDLGI